MNLYDKASLIITANAYKAGKIYAAKPTSGGGDLTFARNSVAYRNNALGVLEQVAINTPRLNYNTIGGCPALLMEPVRTNLLLQSQTLNTTWAATRCTIVADTATAPDNTLTADKIAVSSTVGSKFISQTSNLVVGNIYTYSIFAKAVEETIINIEMGGGFVTQPIASFNLSLGTIVSTTGCTAKITPYQNGWYRCEFTTTTLSNTTSDSFRIGINSASIVTGNGILVWGVQQEMGGFSTSYMPTTTASVTRVGDAVFNSNATSFIGQDAGTILVNYRPYAFGLSAGRIVVSTDDTLNNRIWLAYNTNNTITFFMRNASGVIYTANSTALQVNGLNKIAIAYANGDIRIYLNGVLVLSSSAAMVFGQPRNHLYIGSSETSNDNNQIYIDSCSAYMTALTNSECINITT